VTDGRSVPPLVGSSNGSGEVGTPASHDEKRSDATFDPLLTPKEAAKFLNLSTSWLAKSRTTGEGPEFVKIGHAVRYRMSSLEKFLQARIRKSTKGR
jgi:predicted DNA-binding transcriptional regulator AlpA